MEKLAMKVAEKGFIAASSALKAIRLVESTGGTK
jgi:hypothetical protein